MRACATAVCSDRPEPRGGSRKNPRFAPALPDEQTVVPPPPPSHTVNLHRHNSRPLVLAALLVMSCLLLVGLHYRARQTGRVSLPEQAVLVLVTPLQGALTRFALAARERVRSFRKMRKLEAENRALRKQVAQLRNRNRRLNRYFEENKRLRSYLALNLSVPTEAVFAEVISMPASNWFQRVRINRGSAESIHPKDVVMSDAGLVGQVVDTDRHTATVQLITDRESGVAAQVIRSRAQGVVVGAETGCELRYLDPDADVRLGDQVATSGRGDVYPPGLIIGEVIAVHKDRTGTRYTATIKPATDFTRLDEVFIRKGRQEGRR